MIAVRNQKEVAVMTCPLCDTAAETVFYRDSTRDYFRCHACYLIFVLPSQHLSPTEEKKRYDLHQNSPEDPAYRQFLNRLFEPLVSRLPAGSRGLDFGSGPGPTLSVMFEEAGHSMAVYDTFYAPNPDLLEAEYDFVTATEVLEHLRESGRELSRLWQCVVPGGWLGIMTKLARDVGAFSKWHYKNDVTHVCFFSHETFEWLAEKWQAEVTFIGSDVVLFLKNPHKEIAVTL